MIEKEHKRDCIAILPILTTADKRVEVGEVMGL